MKHKNKMVKAFFMGGVFLLFYFTITNYALAADTSEIYDAPYWIRANELKGLLDTKPEALPRQEKERFDNVYEVLRRRSEELVANIKKLLEEKTSYDKDLAAYEGEEARYNDSCMSTEPNDADSQRCKAWFNRLESWRISGNEWLARLKKKGHKYYSDVNEWHDSVRDDYVWPVEEALSPKKQTWEFKSGKQKAIVKVFDGGIFRGTGWEAKVEGCKPPTIELKIEGKFVDNSVQFTVEGRGCEGREIIRGVGFGEANTVFPNAVTASGIFDGIIIDPLMQRDIMSAKSLTELKKVVKDAISGNRFDLLVQGKSLLEAAQTVLVEVSRQIDETPWEGIRLNDAE